MRDYRRRAPTTTRISTRVVTYSFYAELNVSHKRPLPETAQEKSLSKIYYSPMARRRWGTWVAVILIAAGGLAMPHATQPAGADTLGYASLNGDWNCCQAGGAFAQSWLITNLGGTADTSGTQTAFATIIASQDGDKVTIETKYTNSTYIAIFVGTISCDGNTITGTWTSNSNQVGTFTATRTNYGGPAFVCSPYGRGEAVPLASSISTPGEIFHSPTHDLINGGITIGALLFITFPSSIFNSTFSSHYAEIVEMIAAFKRRLRRRFGAKDAKTNSPVQSSGDSATPGRANFAWFAAVLVIGAILGGLLNPKFGMNGTTVAGFAATIVAFFLGALISGYVARWFRRRHAYPTSTYLHALPLGLAIAAICVLISRYLATSSPATSTASSSASPLPDHSRTSTTRISSSTQRSQPWRSRLSRGSSGFRSTTGQPTAATSWWLPSTTCSDRFLWAVSSAP